MPNNLKKFSRVIIFRSRFLSTLLNKKFFGFGEIDRKLSEFLPSTDGFFVELGANDGISQSNTKHFELHKNWRGILIEPNPKKFDELKLNRSRRSKFINCACVAFDFESRTIDLMYSNLMTIALQGRNDIANRIEHAKYGEKFIEKGKTYEFTVEARTLNSILVDFECPRYPDFLSLDVEGGELEVLNGLDFDHFRFKHILVETRSFDDLKVFLNERHYRLVSQLALRDYLFEDISLREN